MRCTSLRWWHLVQSSSHGVGAHYARCCSWRRQYSAATVSVSKPDSHSQALFVERFSARTLDLHVNEMPAKTPNAVRSTILATHGLLGSANNWRSILTSATINQHRRVLLCDLRDHGASPHTPAASLQFISKHESLQIMSADVLKIATKQQSASRLPLIGMGHSLGGKVMMTAALNSPPSFAALIIVDIAPFDYTPPPESHKGGEWNGVSHIVHHLAKIDLTTIQDRRDADAQLKDAIPDASTRSFVLANLVPASPRADTRFVWRCNLESLVSSLPDFARFDVGAATPNPLMPVLFIAGEKSGFIGEKHHASISRWFPQASIEVISDAGHWVHADKPKETIVAIDNFLNQHNL